MLVNLAEICALAEKRGIAVGAFNAVSLASLKAVVGAAEELGQPVVLQFAQCHECYNSIEDLAPLMLKYARRASVPVCVHLDHGEDLDYIKRVLELGFTGVMFDGSTLPHAENAELSRRAAELAAGFGAGAEAELGSMGRRSTGEADSDAPDPTKIYTDPAEAAVFARATGIAALACSFGTTHGVYLTEPRLDMDIVARVRELTGLPVVMHGGSGVSPEDYRRAVKAGVRKINYFTYMDKAGACAVRDRLLSESAAHPLFTELTLTAEQAMKENVKSAIRVFSGL